MTQYHQQSLCCLAALLVNLACSEGNEPDTPECLSTCSASECGGQCPDVEQVPIGRFSIDQKRVTRREYERFMSPNIPFQSSEYCAEEYVNWREPLGDEPIDIDDAIVAVTWCQANAYCEWAEKRLCGRQGGGSLRDEDLMSPMRDEIDEWYAACISENPELEGMPLEDTSEWLNGAAEVEGVEGALFAAFPTCSAWSFVDWGATRSRLGFRCCSDI